MGGKRLTEDTANASGVLLTVVLYGDGSFGSSMRGSEPGSHTSIKRALAACATAAVLDTDERFPSRSVVRKAPLRKGGFPKGKKGPRNLQFFALISVYSGSGCRERECG